MLNTSNEFQQNASKCMATLTHRQMEVMDLVIAGLPSKTIAYDLGISQRTVDSHRSAIARKTGCHAFASLVHNAICSRCTLAKDADSALEAKVSELGILQFHMDEVSHRVKNLIAIVQAISNQTMRQSTTKEEFNERFRMRLRSISDSFHRLAHNNWHGGLLSDVVRQNLTAFQDSKSTQIAIHGPIVALTPAADQNIGLALNELATNAIKYGALSVPEGRVDISWHCDSRAFQPSLTIEWSETGGPTVIPPTRRGFGRDVIERVSAFGLGGKAVYEFLPSGVHWKLSVPMRTAVHAVQGASELLPT